MENLVELLNDDVAELPIDGGDDLEQILADKFDNYLTALKKLDSSDPAAAVISKNISNILNLSTNILDALDHWLKAAPEKAFSALSAGLAPLDTQLAELTTTDVTSGPLFRVRTATLGDRLSKEQLFHIPYHQRDRISTQRYSFPGLPCLYFGRSIYVCWEELGRPDLSSLWISKFVVTPSESVKFLDFGHRPALVAAGLDHHRANSAEGYPEKKATAYAILWPLIAACSVKRQSERMKNFVVEYVIPQLLLRWLVDRMGKNTAHRIDGIRYFSTHINDHMVEIAGMNYVFSAQQRKKTGHCPTLKGKFQLTPPVNWQIAMSLPRRAPVSFNKVRFEITPGHCECYHLTDFARVERFVHALQEKSL